jgi:DNA-binding response OmpR family regulator
MELSNVLGITAPSKGILHADPWDMHSIQPEGMRSHRGAVASPAQPATGEELSPHHLLLAEDDGPFRFLLATALRKDGHHVVAVSNGVDLLDILTDSLSPDGTFAPFDLVLSDLRMPGWPGLEALTGVVINPGMPPLILFTAFGDEATHRRAREIGALTLLDKPFDLDQLRALVIQILDQTSQKRGPTR